jgi:magnesium chelatase family protein
MRRIILPASNAREAAMVQGIDIHPCASLREALGIVDGTHPGGKPYRVNFAEVFEQQQSRRSWISPM